MSAQPVHDDSLHAWSRLGPALCVLCLVLVATGGYLLDQSRPETPNLFDKRWEGTVRQTWDLGLARTAFSLLLAGLAISVLGLGGHLVLSRGRADASSRLLGVFGALALVGLLYYFAAGPPL